MKKVDLKKELKHLYNPSKRVFSVVEVPPMSFLMVDGHGDPNTSRDYADALDALYAVSYALKFMSKKELERDYTVMPLEGLWWAEEMARFSVERKGDWLWTAMIMQPEWIIPEMVAQALEATRRTKKLAALGKLRFETYDEGLSVQIMHIGSYAVEAPTLERMHHEFIPSQGYEMTGKHHEIYLSDPRRTDPNKLRIVLRQPVRLAA